MANSKGIIAGKVVLVALWIATRFPFLRRFLQMLRPFVTAFLYRGGHGDYLIMLRSEKYKGTDVAIIQAPGWGVNTPPLAIARLTAYLRVNGMRVMPVDVNAVMYRDNKDRYPDGWKDSVDYFWTNPAVVEMFLGDNKAILDAYLDAIVESGVKVAGFSVYTSSLAMSIYMAKELKKRKKDIVTVFGGAAVSVFMGGMEMMKENDCVDVVVEGEGEVTLLEIVKDAREGRGLRAYAGAAARINGIIKEGPPRELIKDLDTLPFADFSDYDFFMYREPFKLPLESCRGCVNRCIFCNERTFWKKYRFRSGDALYEEIKYQTAKYPHVTYIEFHDSLCNGNIRELERMCNRLMEDGARFFWGGQAIVRKEMTYDLLVKLKKSGCVTLAYGLESTSKTVLARMGKVFSRDADIDRLMRDSYKAGVGAGLNFMFGFPGETDAEAEENVEFLRRNAPYIFAVNPSSAFFLVCPGTEAYMYPEKFGIDLSKGGWYWDSVDGKNTYLKRLERFERFISEVHRLKIPCTYPHATMINRNEVIANYYYHIGGYGEAIPYYEESIRSESDDRIKRAKLAESRERVGLKIGAKEERRTVA
ncbi:MAG: B12-binding domain-containing radical SAM protein [Deltaproteobacteria bacterium]|nr:B12-binding domain-containing radical SAM protein [Deltaproteobacteria bacterium]